MDSSSSAEGPPPPRPPSIYDVAAAAGVATSTVSRALSKPGRVSFRTAEHVRKVAAELGYRAEPTERALPGVRTKLLTMVVADITNPVFFGMIRGAERTASHAGYQMVLGETQESEARERHLVDAMGAASDGLILTSSRLTDGAIRTLAKATPLVVLNRHVDQVPSVVSDNVRAVKRVVEHLASGGHRSLTYLAGPGGLVGRRDALAGTAGGGPRAGPQGAADRSLPADDERRPAGRRVAGGRPGAPAWSRTTTWSRSASSRR